ncbi:MAG: hypothetical protein PHR25_06550 [Clostridia bacterium]|nr:hypothetical protein [Clostridia bacterium]
MIKKNIVFIGYPLDIGLNNGYENRIALWKSDYDKLNCYDEVIDLGDILNKLFGKERDKLLELELCNKIMSLIDNNTIAIIDTSMAGHSLFEDYEELYNQLNKHLEKLNNKDIKIFLCEPLNFMGKIRYNSVNKQYNELIKIMKNKVSMFKDKEFTKASDLKKHENSFIEYFLDDIKLIR